jgi:DNA modification methylase
MTHKAAQVRKRTKGHRVKEAVAPYTVAPVVIPFARSCDCPPNRINCSTPKAWIKNQVAIWELYYTNRDIRDKSIHPASFPIALPARCIEQFTHRGELVLDPFVGIGSTLVAAQDLGRSAVGFDLKKEYIEKANARLAESLPFDKAVQQIAIQADAREIARHLPENSVALCVTSPPYANMLNRQRLNKTYRTDLRQNEHFKKNLQYSNDSRDLGTLKAEQYAAAMAEIYKGIFPLMKPKAHCIVNVNDLWEDNRRILLHIHIIEALQSVGYELRNIIIWDKRNLVNKVGIYGWPNNFITLSITFEYILDFWKPASS